MFWEVLISRFSVDFLYFCQCACFYCYLKLASMLSLWLVICADLMCTAPTRSRVWWCVFVSTASHCKCRRRFFLLCILWRRFPLWTSCLAFRRINSSDEAAILRRLIPPANHNHAAAPKFSPGRRVKNSNHSRKLLTKSTRTLRCLLTAVALCDVYTFAT